MRSEPDWKFWWIGWSIDHWPTPPCPAHTYEWPSFTQNHCINIPAMVRPPPHKLSALMLDTLSTPRIQRTIFPLLLVHLQTAAALLTLLDALQKWPSSSIWYFYPYVKESEKSEMMMKLESSGTEFSHFIPNHLNPLDHFKYSYIFAVMRPQLWITVSWC